MRVSFNGRTSSFQDDSRGSIPLARSNFYEDYVEKKRRIKNIEKIKINRGGVFYTVDNDFNQIINDVTSDFINNIFCDDSENLLKLLPNNCIDLIITSPPYNFGLEYDKTSDSLFWKNYFIKLFSIFDECIRVLKFGGRIVVNVQPCFSDYIPTHHIISNYFMNKKLIWKGEILWEKNNYNCKYTAWGSWMSPSSPYLKYTWEFLEIFCKGNLKKEGLLMNSDLSADEFKDWTVAKWIIAPEKDMDKYDHPAMFPEELVGRIIKLFSFKNDIILDPFNGVGTTTFVAKVLERRFIGIDIAKKYCEKAKDRVFNYFF